MLISMMALDQGNHKGGAELGYARHDCCYDGDVTISGEFR